MTLRTASRAIVLAGLTFFCLPVFAEFTSPVGLAVIALHDKAYLEFPRPRDNVFGLRLGLIRSVHTEVTGIDIGLIQSFSRDYTGPLQFSGMTNVVAGKARVLGLQWGGIFNLNRQVTIVGMQFALFNTIFDKGTIVGAQFGLFNEAPKTDIYGIQMVLFNHAHKVVGLQVGLVNSAASLYGVQIGLLNFNQNGPIPFFPGINIGF